ncbi:putative cytochrome P450 3A24 [Apostichopus japonicus]|uniref:Putative cytochrome P450 3A24 n=1 Tax=Stichopus japonicus TaxID=307972 RepID=A0A2G8K4E4_STIJA|nr:putative cytochrome P450 3A24 [Apostichopus japonicus]
MELTTWVLIASVIIIACVYDYWRKSYFKQRGIPCDTILPFLGHYHKFISGGFTEFIHRSAKQHGKIFGMLLGSSPVVVIGDADILKEILVRKFSSFHNRRPQAIDDYPVNKALTRLEGARWKQVRNTITPAFSASKMKPIAALLNDSCDALIKHMKAKVATNPDIEVKEMYGNMTMDCIAKGGFGLQVDSQEDPNDPFVNHAKAIINMNLLNPRVIIASKKFFMDVTQQAMHMRHDKASKRVDVLQLMVDAQETDDSPAESEDMPEIAGGEEKGLHRKTELTEAEIMAQSLIFFLAGYSTTTVALSFVSYNLATHPELQDKLFQEVQEMAPDRDSVNYDTVNKMEYLDKFLSETLRLFPPLLYSIRISETGAHHVGADRVCQDSVTVGDFHFEKGMDIFYNIIGIHYDPDYWEDPEKFDPERFTKEATEKRHPFAYLPFGTGPRNCIGMRFALLVLKMAIVRMVQTFQFEPCEQTQIPIKFGKRSVSPDKGITLRVVARE